MLSHREIEHGQVSLPYAARQTLGRCEKQGTATDSGRTGQGAVEMPEDGRRFVGVQRLLASRAYWAVIFCRTSVSLSLDTVAT